MLKRKIQVLDDISTNAVPKLRRKCCVPNCSSNNTSSSLFTFPACSKTKNESFARCATWVSNVQNKDLEYLPLDILKSRYYVCVKHFRDDQFMNHEKKRLKVTAIPTLFPNQKCNINNQEFNSHYSKGGRINDVQRSTILHEKEDCISDLQQSGALLDQLPSCSSDSLVFTYEIPSSDEVPKHNGTGLVLRKCSAMNCQETNVSSNLNSFPGIYSSINGHKHIDVRKLQRCRDWVQKCGNESLLMKNPSLLQNNYFLCNHHFLPNAFMEKQVERLKRNAEPKVFECEPISVPRMETYDLMWNIITPETTNIIDDTFFANGNENTKIMAHQNTTETQFNMSQENSNSHGSENSNLHGIRLFEMPSDDQTHNPPIVQGNLMDRYTEGDMTSKEKPIRKKCCATGCANNNLTSPMFSFPQLLNKKMPQTLLDMVKLNRYIAWVKSTGNATLLINNPLAVYKKYFLCGDHFMDECFLVGMRKRLKPNAIPTSFKQPSLNQHLIDQYIIDIENWKAKGCPEINFGNNNRTIMEENDAGLPHVSSSGKQNSNCSGPSKDMPNEQVNFTNENNGISIENSNSQINSEDSFTLKTKQVKRSCAASSCAYTNLTSTMFHFPNVLNVKIGQTSLNNIQLKRYIAWITATGNKKLLLTDPYSVYKKYFLCGNHFMADCFVNSTNKRLKSDAIPTLFKEPVLNENLIEQYSTYLEKWKEKDFSEMCFDLDKDCATAFEEAVQNLKWNICGTCKEKVMTTEKNPNCLHGSRCWEYSDINNMDPGNVPPELEGLSYIEEQLIARIHPIVTVFKLQGLQFGYRGNVINFSQDVVKFSTELPHNIKDLSSVMKVKYHSKVSNKVHDFHVRSHKIFMALKWLKANNPFYNDINISEENLRTLPEDGNVYGDIQTIAAATNNTENANDSLIDSSDTDNEESNNSECDDDSEGSNTDTEEAIEDDYVHHSGVPQLSLPNQDQQVKASLNWPELDSQPVDEFNTVGYIACAFPSLFPYGKADFRDCRVKQIQTSNYFKHLLRYEDDRFARHRTFRFFAYNSWMRWTALTDGNIFIRNNPEYKNMTASRLKEKLNENPNILRKIMFQASNLRGTKAFWHTRANELRDMVNQLGLPTVFLTLSCADGHWTELYKLLTNSEDISMLTEKERRKLLQENPHIVDMFFDHRIKAFIKHVLIRKYKVVDYWYRIEYQHRGSPHLHGIFWFEGAPDTSNLENETREKLQEVLQYFQDLITAINPIPNCEDPDTHPCRQSYTMIQDFVKDLSQILNKVQRHTKCSRRYCLKFNKKTKVIQCRFKFPMEMQDHASLEKSDSGEFEFKPCRNDPLLNKYNELIIQLWRANIDIAPVISKKALLSYLAKYISKCEVSSQALDQLLSDIIDKLDENDYAKKAIQRLFVKSCAERDISAQEVCHTLLSLKLYSTGGRKFVIVNFSSKNWIEISNEDSEEQRNYQNRSFIDKYRDRPKELEDVSLWECASLYNVPKWTKASKAHIVRIFPKIKCNKNSNSNEQYFEQQVYLHVPWRTQENLKSGDQTWEEIWNCHTHENAMNTRTLEDCEMNESEDEWESDCDDSDDDALEEWMILSRLGPNSHVPEVKLGYRQEDLNYDWTATYEKYKQYGSLPEFQCFLDKLKEKYKDVVENDTPMPQVQFSDDQLEIVNLMNKQIDNIIHGTPDDTVKRVIVQGKAGTGKSLLIKYLTSTVTKKLGRNALLVATPTGVSAILINGKTLHSLFCIPKKRKDFKPLNGERARKLCNKLADVKFLLLDEYSMIGCAALEMINSRCKQATGNTKEPFGGLHVYLFGDVNQLPPVKDSPFYSNNQKSVLSKLGKIVCSKFQKAFILSSCHRQQDLSFLNILNNLSCGKFDQADYRQLSTRFITNVSSSDQKDFHDAIRLFSTREEVKDYNLKKLSELIDKDTGAPCPVAKIPAKNNCSAAKKASSEEAEGLENVIYLSPGCQILLKSNIWLEKCLVNGSMGKVIDILYDHDKEPPNDQPSVILCEFNNYSGQGLVPDSKIIPIKPILKSWTSADGQNCTRYQFPITLCYACSIHKSQGLTLESAVVNIGKKEFALGLSYVALSRVRSMDKLLLYPFTMDRLKKLKDNSAMHCRKNFLQKICK